KRTSGHVVVAGDDVVERVDHRVAGHVDPRGVDGLAQEVLSRALRRREVEVSEEVDDAAVRLFRERPAHVARAEPGFDVGDPRPTVERGQAGGESGRRITLNDDPVRALGLDDRGGAGQHGGGQRREGLVRSHEREVVVGHDVEEIQDRLEHLAVLTGDAHADVELIPDPELTDDRAELDRFGARAEDDEDAHAQTGLEGTGRSSSTSPRRTCADAARVDARSERSASQLSSNRAARTSQSNEARSGISWRARAIASTKKRVGLQVRPMRLTTRLPVSPSARRTASAFPDARRPRSTPFGRYAARTPRALTRSTRTVEVQRTRSLLAR